MRLTPFERNYNLFPVFYSRSLDWGMYFQFKPRDWLRVFWSHPEADVIWYIVGPFAFFTTGKHS